MPLINNCGRINILDVSVIGPGEVDYLHSDRARLGTSSVERSFSARLEQQLLYAQISVRTDSHNL